MTDTVNVPEVGMEDAPDWYCHDSASGWACGWNACREYLLAASPKAEPNVEVKAIAYVMAHEAAKEMGYPSLTEALEDLDLLRTQPEAPKVEQEPCSACFECGCQPTHPAPASDELLKALEGLVRDWHEDDISTADVMNGIDDLIAKHKGPQS